MDEANGLVPEDLQQLSPEFSKSRVHPVIGYTDKENLWEKIWNMERTDAPPSKYTNNRSSFYLQVEGKQLKLKRNPLLDPPAQSAQTAKKEKDDKGNEDGSEAAEGSPTTVT